MNKTQSISMCENLRMKAKTDLFDFIDTAQKRTANSDPSEVQSAIDEALK